MTKPVAIIVSFITTLLLWSTQVSGETFTAEDVDDSSAQYFAQASGQGISIGHSSGLLQQIGARFRGLGFSAPSRMERSGGTGGIAPSWDGAPVPQRSMPESHVTMAVPTPAGPPPNGFLGGVLAPSQYSQGQPIVAGYGSPPGYYGPPRGYGYPPNYPPLSDPGSVHEQRIVYVPYAAPPPIYVERLGKALPRPIVRRVLGDANMYEYPEMPLRTYTTRGPRDFMAPNPPSIGY
jgi:hypothetical protein